MDYTHSEFHTRYALFGVDTDGCFEPKHSVPGPQYPQRIDYIPSIELPSYTIGKSIGSAALVLINQTIYDFYGTSSEQAYGIRYARATYIRSCALPNNGNLRFTSTAHLLRQGRVDPFTAKVILALEPNELAQFETEALSLEFMATQRD